MFRRITFGLSLLLALASMVYAHEDKPLPTSYPGIHVVSPQQQAVVRPGQEVPVTLEIDPSLKPASVLIMGNLFRAGITLEMDGPPFHGMLKIPDDLSGPVELGVLVKNTEDKIIGGLGLNLNVIAEEVPLSIDPGTHQYLKIPPWDYLPARTTHVRGKYHDNISRDISHSSTGTKYRSNDTTIVTVSAEGVLEPQSPGRAFIIVEHRGLKAFVAIDVEGNGITFWDFPPVDYSNDVSITTTQPRFLEGTVRYEMDVTIRNNADLPLHKPLHLVVNGLSVGIRVADSNKTERLDPVGSPYVFVDMDESAFLSPGKTAHAKIIFINFDKKPITPELKLFSGGRL